MMFNNLSRCELSNRVLGYETNQFRVKNRINSVWVGYILIVSSIYKLPLQASTSYILFVALQIAFASCL